MPLVDESDSDGDGASDLAETIAGTDPDDASSFLRTTITLAPQPGIALDGKVGRIYQLQASETLAADDWATILTDGPLTSDTPLLLEDSAAPGAFDKRFYRVRADLSFE